MFIDNESVIHLANHCPLLEVVNFNYGAVSKIALISYACIAYNYKWTFMILTLIIMDFNILGIDWWGYSKTSRELS